jgi:hypothetical protein
VAAAIAAGRRPASLGRPAGDIATPLDLPRIDVGERRIRGHGRFLDTFGNILTDIPVAMVRRTLGDSRRVEATVNGREIGPLYEYYAAAGAGQLIALVNSWGMIEVAAVNGNAAALLQANRPVDVAIDLSVRR